MPELRIALDRSVRRIDPYGRLVVEVANITKANVGDYRGNEIPGYEALGLSPSRFYRLLRDPGELEKAAPTFNMLPLLIVHKPQHADAHSRELTVGTTGSEARWEAPYIRNSLIVWDREGIDAIESEEQRELSAGYGYDPDMTPGEYQGERYDGVMRNIRGNHIALVEDGRAGPDVVVGDSKPKELDDMPGARQPMKLSLRATTAQGLLAALVLPKIAQDKKPTTKLNFRKIVGADTTAKNWKDAKPKIIDRLRTDTQGLLAQDANLDEVVELLNKLDDDAGVEGSPDDDIGVDQPPPETKPNAAAPPFPPKKVEEDEDEGDVVSKVLALIGDKLPPEDVEAIRKLLKPEPDANGGNGGGMDEDEGAGGSNTSKTDKPDKPEMMTKQAMDAAIKRARKEAEDATIARLRSIRDAERTVQPWVGELAMAQDSADGVFKAALDTLGVDLPDDVPPAAYKHILLAQPKPGDEPRARSERRMAMDTSSSAGLAQRFPGVPRMRVL